MNNTVPIKCEILEYKVHGIATHWEEVKILPDLQVQHETIRHQYEIPKIHLYFKAKINRDDLGIGNLYQCKFGNLFRSIANDTIVNHHSHVDTFTIPTELTLVQSSYYEMGPLDSECEPDKLRILLSNMREMRITTEQLFKNTKEKVAQENPFLRKVLFKKYLGNRQYSDLQKGFFHQWGSAFEEFESGPGNYSVAIVEDETGQVHLIQHDCIQFADLLPQE